LGQINRITPSGAVSLILMSAILELSNISVRRGERIILGPVDWQVLDGQRWVILGPNGAGKTTLLQICSSLIHPTTGTIKILGEQLGKVDVFELRTRIGYGCRSNCRLRNAWALARTI
jgi:ABC-type molybdenum transport system ATPase subunit/photorepair protein PhrA